jgi:hypothetical protein
VDSVVLLLGCVVLRPGSVSRLSTPSWLTFVTEYYSSYLGYKHPETSLTMAGAGAVVSAFYYPSLTETPTSSRVGGCASRLMLRFRTLRQLLREQRRRIFPTTEATDVSSDQLMKAARDRNMMAVAYLTTSFQDDGLLNMVEQSTTTNWPSGLACVVIDELFKRYRPVDIVSRVEMRTRLNHVSMKKDDDPRVMFDQLASIQSAYNDATRKIDPDDLITVVLEKAPE